MSHREDKKGIGWWTTSTRFVMFKAAGFGTSAYSDYCVPLRFSQTGMLIMIASGKEWVILTFLKTTKRRWSSSRCVLPGAEPRGEGCG